MDSKKLNSTYYRRLFIVRATWNWSLTLLLVLTWRKFLTYFDMFVPELPVWIFLSCGLIFISGIGNYIVSRNLDKNHAVIQIDILGRILFTSLFVYYYLMGESHIIFVFVALGDMIIAALALEFLLRYKRNKKALGN